MSLTQPWLAETSSGAQRLALGRPWPSPCLSLRISFRYVDTLLILYSKYKKVDKGLLHIREGTCDMWQPMHLGTNGILALSKERLTGSLFRVDTIHLQLDTRTSHLIPGRNSNAILNPTGSVISKLHLK